MTDVQAKRLMQRGRGRKWIRLEEDKVRRAVNNFILTKIDSATMEKLWQNLDSFAQAALLSQLLKYESAYKMRELDLEETQIQRLPPDQLKWLYEKLLERKQQSQIEISVVYENGHQKNEGGAIGAPGGADIE